MKKVLNDIEQAKEFIEITHPIGSKLHWDEYIIKTPLHIYIQKNLAKLKDAHTDINLGSLNYKKPGIRFRFINKRLYISSCSIKDLIGKEAEIINNKKIYELKKLFEPYISFEHKNRIDVVIPHYILNKDYVKNILKDKSLKVGFKKAIYKFDFNDEKVILWTENLKDHDSEIVENRERDFWIKEINPNTLYFQYNRCNLKAKNLLEKELDKYVNKQRKLIIDLRTNGGGNSSAIYPLYKKIKMFKEIFVLISKYTFSSAIMNALDLKNEYGAILVGEESAQTINSFGEVKQIKLSNSGLLINCSTKYWTLTKHNDVLKPDVYIKEDPNYLITGGKDTVLEYALNSAR